MQITRKEGISIADLLAAGNNEIQVTRLRRVGSNLIIIPGYLDELNPGDVVTVVGTPKDLDAVLLAGGRESP